MIVFQNICLGIYGRNSKLVHVKSLFLILLQAGNLNIYPCGYISRILTRGSPDRFKERLFIRHIKMALFFKEHILLTACVNSSKIYVQ